MDGIDAALVRISGPATQPRVRLVAFETLAYSAPVRQTILRIATGESATAGEISQLNFLLGELFAEAALRVCHKARVSPARLAAIGSHGQTIYHQGAPTREGGRSITSTLQIAEPSVIAERTGAPVVADFRTGGHGRGRPRRAAGADGGLSAPARRAQGNRGAQHRRHRQLHGDSRRRQAGTGFRLRHGPRKHDHRRAGPAFYQRVRRPTMLGDVGRQRGE